MITTVKESQVTKLTWNKSHVGMIHWNSYWLKFSLVLSVREIGTHSKIHEVRELDYFGTSCSPLTVREHVTPLRSDDRFYTVEEFNDLISNGEVVANALHY